MFWPLMSLHQVAHSCIKFSLPIYTASCHGSSVVFIIKTTNLKGAYVMLHISLKSGEHILKGCDGNVCLSRQKLDIYRVSHLLPNPAFL